MEEAPSPLESLAILLEGDHPELRAAELLRGLGGLSHLASAPRSWLERVGGLSCEESARVFAGVQLGVQALSAPPALPRTCPEDVVGMVSARIRRDVEEVWVLTVGSGLRPLHLQMVARGGVDACGVTAASVLRCALLDGASGLFLVHNHPSGDTAPSRADLRFTERLQRACGLLGIKLHDHLVLGGLHWQSCLHRGSRGPL